MEGADGVVVISTKLDTKQLEQQLKQQENQLKKYEKEAEKLTTTKAKLDVDLQSYEKEKQALAENVRQQMKLTSTAEQRVALANQYKTGIQSITDRYSEQLSKVKDIDNQLERNAKRQSLIRTEIAQTNNELGRSKGIDRIKDILKDTEKGISKNIKKVGKWMLALFGIRAVYGFIRNSINQITANDEKLKSDIDYIKAVFAYTLEPVIRKIVDLVKVLTQYIAYIIQEWTGENIFENADKALKNANKSAKDLKKQLAGFDEANVMSDNKSGASIGGNIKPLENGQVPTWLDWIAKNGDKVAQIIGGITGALLALKFGLSGIQALGFGIMLAGVIQAVQGLIGYLKDPTWENFGKIIQGIGIFVIGLGVAIGGLPVILAGVGTLLFGLIVQNWENIKGFLQGGIDWLASIGDWIGEHLGENVQALWQLIVNQLQSILNYFDGAIQAIRKIFDGIIDFIAGIFTGDWNRVWEGIKKIFGGIWDWMANSVKLTFNTIKTIIQGAIGIIASVFEGLWNGLKAGFQGVVTFFTNLVGGIWNAIKGFINFFIDGINILIRGMNKLQWDVPDWVPIIGGQKWGINIQEVPRLASGAIVNNPGSGVMMGNYIAGEHGREAIIPLTDPSAMSALGQEIARYCNINNAVELNVDSRRLGRVMQQSQNASNFARNV